MSHESSSPPLPTKVGMHPYYAPDHGRTKAPQAAQRVPRIPPLENILPPEAQNWYDARQDRFPPPPTAVPLHAPLPPIRAIQRLEPHAATLDQPPSSLTSPAVYSLSPSQPVPFAQPSVPPNAFPHTNHAHAPPAHASGAGAIIAGGYGRREYPQRKEVTTQDVVPQPEVEPPVVDLVDSECPPVGSPTGTGGFTPPPRSSTPTVRTPSPRARSRSPSSSSRSGSSR